MARKFAAFALGLALLAGNAAFWAWLLLPRPPASTDIVLVDGPQPPPADPALLPQATAGATATIGFVGDIMQHHNQRNDAFATSYANMVERLRGFDLLVGNLEFPVDSEQPVGPARSSVRFNGSPAHLDALAGAGFGLLSLANNHAFDQGLDGLHRTIAAVESRGMAVVGGARRLDEVRPAVRDVQGIRVGVQGFTYTVNGYPAGTSTLNDDMVWPPRDFPVLSVNFADWRGPWRAQGQAVFQAQADAARRGGAEFLVAVVHWGDEWHLAPSEDQRRAARDLIDAGFDLVVGSHPHVLSGSELIGGRLVAYSLGNFISDFVPLETRTGAILSATLGRTPEGVRLVDFAFVPTVVDRAEGHRIREADGDAAAHARRLLGPGVR